MAHNRIGIHTFIDDFYFDNLHFTNDIGEEKYHQPSPQLDFFTQGQAASRFLWRRKE